MKREHKLVNYSYEHGMDIPFGYNWKILFFRKGNLIKSVEGKPGEDGLQWDYK